MRENEEGACRMIAGCVDDKDKDKEVAVMENVGYWSMRRLGLRISGW